MSDDNNKPCHDPIALLVIGLGIVVLKITEKFAESTFSEMAEEMQKTSRKC